MFSLFWLKKHQYILILALIGVFFILIYSWIFINYDSSPKFTSPDETANYYFINLFANKSQLKFLEPMNQLADGIIRPRSMGYANGYTVPGSFLGIVLIYGTIAKILGNSAIIYLTPIFSLIGVLFFYLLVKRIFQQHIAFISSLLLFVLPPFWYYNVRGLFHNILFIDLLIIGLYFFVQTILSEQKKTNYWLYLLSGLFTGLALVVRTSEFFWVIGIFLTMSILGRRNLSWLKVSIFFGTIIVLLIPVLSINHQIYGSVTSFAYSSQPVTDTSVNSLSNTIFIKIRQLLLPFDVNWERIGQVSYQYLITIFPWFSVLLIIGLFWFLRNEIIKLLKRILPGIKSTVTELNKIQKIYIWIFLAISIWLIIYYGSYIFYEYIDKTKIILASSYTRYWLPIYVFGLPIAVMAVFKIAGIFKIKIIRRSIIFALPILFIFFSVNMVVNDPLHGLKQTRQNISDNKTLNSQMVKLTDKNSVIIAGNSDKVIFPERKVIVRLPQDSWQKTKLINNLLGQTKLYYLSNPLDSDYGQIMEYLSNHYTLLPLKQFPGDQGTLFQIE